MPGRRLGFTLIELLVVMSILAVLATLAVLFLPNVEQESKAARGADLVQGWLFIARQRARRDQVPVGLRLIADAQNQVRELHYVQQPDPYTVGQCLGGSGSDVAFSPDVDFLGGAATLGEADQATVQAGDYLEVAGGGAVQRIADVRPGGHLVLNDTTATIPASGFYRIFRQPRRLAGEQPLVLPQDVAIDLHASRSLNVPARTIGVASYSEILFSPAGTVLGASSDRIFLWVRDVSQSDPFARSPTLVVIQTRTGMIAAHPVNPPPAADPHAFGKDHRSSGM